MKLVDPRRAITIELTPEDQDILYTVTRHVGGNPLGPRAAIIALAEILKNAGAEEIQLDIGSQGIYFT